MWSREREGVVSGSRWLPAGNMYRSPAVCAYIYRWAGCEVLVPALLPAGHVVQDLLVFRMKGVNPA